MKNALEGQPPTPFRIPPGIKNVKVNAKTGARAQPGDAKTIWEAFLPGTAPGTNRYLLGGEGINRYENENDFDAPYSENGTGNGYTPPPSYESPITGTGGLY